MNKKSTLKDSKINPRYGAEHEICPYRVRQREADPLAIFTHSKSAHGQKFSQKTTKNR